MLLSGDKIRVPLIGYETQNLRIKYTVYSFQYSEWYLHLLLNLFFFLSFLFYTFEEISSKTHGKYPK